MADTTSYETLIQGFLDETANQSYWRVEPGQTENGRALLALPPGEQIQALLTVCQQISGPHQREKHQDQSRLGTLRSQFLMRLLPYTASDLEALLSSLNPREELAITTSILRQVERFQKSSPLTNAMCAAMRKLQDSLPETSSDYRKVKVWLATLLGDPNETLPSAGDRWAELAREDVGALPDVEQTAWKRLFYQVQSPDGGKPPKEWSKATATFVEAIPAEQFSRLVARWFRAVTSPGLTTIQHQYGDRTYEHQGKGGSDRNIDFLKGLAWCCVDSSDADVARGLAALTEGCLKKVPGIGPWAIRAASAAVYALGVMPAPEALTQLGRLKNKVTFRTTLTQIEKALDAAAAKAGITKDELEDLAVPGYGLDAEGNRTETFGEYMATVTLSPTGDATLTCRKGDKPIKTVPADVKKTFAEDWKAFKADVDGIGQSVGAQRDRLERAVFPVRTWGMAAWRERYLAHPLLGHLSRRLIWQIADGERVEAVLPTPDGLLGVDGAPVADFSDAATVALWHPLGKPVEAVLQWRALLEARQIVQPFKQAHREVYLLTDAERSTGTYSNRFAGHILKQHQMNALAAQRGWQNKLRLMVDDVYPPASRDLPTYDLRAEFWIEGIGDNYGTDTTESGTYLRLSTDQVRFYRRDAPVPYAHAGGGGYGFGRQQVREALPLAEIDPLVFSEVLRDVDLFVGVASVGNDPNWSDGGPGGTYRNYWHEYSFGELGPTAKTRAETLAKLLPRLKLRDKATLDGKFLRVQGSLRTYKIHLGSGNILMEPNDQYLCIVEDRRQSGLGDGVFLPFEGDARLAVILSKAFLLADDSKITDATIVRQIERTA